jgi:peptidoglycan/LPS O-acetylase OafA/YrhL
MLQIQTHRFDIDGLRAIAVLMVLVFHFDLFPAGTAGFIGVDVFFVISGFLITSIIDRQMDAGTFRLREFYLSRIRRLAPALFVTLSLVIVAGLICLFPAELISLIKEVVAAQLYVANIYYWRTINYFGLSANSAFLLHTWSLGVEEQFYLFYPICIAFIHKHFKQHRWIIIFAAMLLSFALNLVFILSKPEAVFYLLPTRAWELLIGAMVIPASRLQITKQHAGMLGLVGFALLVAGYLSYNKDIHFPGFFALMPTVGTGAILTSGSSAPGTLAYRILSNRKLGHIGVISYPLYLVHWPLTIFTASLVNDYDMAWRIAMFAISLAIAELIYRFVEQPIRGNLILTSNNKLKMGYAAGLIYTIAISGFIWTTGGAPERFPPEVIRLASYSQDRMDPLSQCDYHGQSLMTNSDFCFIGDSRVAPTWLIYGDSHAWATHDVFDKWLIEKSQSGLFVFQHACPPLENIHLVHDRGQCFAFNRAVLKFLAQSPDVRNIVLVSIWRQAIEGVLSDSEDRTPTKEESVVLFQNGFSETLQNLRAHGKSIYIWEPVPGAKRSVPQAIAKAALLHKTDDIRFSAKEYLSTYKFFFDALSANRSLIKQSFSPSKMVCSSGICSILSGKTPLYVDNNHITKSSSEFWLKTLTDAD